MKIEPTPWRTLLMVAAGVGVAPPQFWALSLREWRAMTAPVGEALTRDAFQLLAERFPDKQI